MTRLILAAGGTAGHVLPALAVAEALRARDPSYKILFCGSGLGFGSKLLPASGYPVRRLSASPLLREPFGGKLRAPFNLARSIFEARALLAGEKAGCVLGTGGYASAGPILAARSLGLPTAILECNAEPGLANRFLGRLAGRIYLGCDAAARWFPIGRSVVSGVPIRAEIAALTRERREPPAKGTRMRILVLGGSEGSPFINRRVPELLSGIASKGIVVQVQHQSGERDLDAVREAYTRAGVEASVAAFIGDVVTAYRQADFAITCAGAGTLAELAAAGVPALLIPLSSAARDHQAVNAAAFVRSGAGWWSCEAEFKPQEQAARIAAFVRDPSAWSAAAAQAHSLARPDAAAVIANDLASGPRAALL